MMLDKTRVPVIVGVGQVTDTTSPPESALRLLEPADGRSTLQRLACEGNVPTTSAVEFFRGAELAGMLNLSGSLIGGLR